MCQGTGIVRSVESVALDVLRSLEDRLITDGVVPLVATTAVDVALYILNQKRSHLKDIEQRYRIPITVTADENLHVSQFLLERSAESDTGMGESTVVQMDWAHHHPSPAPSAAHPASSEGDSEQVRRRSRRRRRKRRGPGDQDSEGFEPAHSFAAEAHDHDNDDDVQADDDVEDRPERAPEVAEGGQQNRKPRRRGRRGGRRGRSGQRPERNGVETGSEAAGHAGEGHGTGTGARDHAQPKPSSEARPHQNGGSGHAAREEIRKPPSEPVEAPREPTFSVPIVERPASPPDIRVESETKDEAGPPRRGWWSR
jgi:ribonuclease E